MRKSILIRAGIGFLAGMVIGLLISWAVSGGGALAGPKSVALFGSVPAAVVMMLLLSGVLGAVSMGGTAVYEIERWPVALSSVTHFLMIALSYTPIALLLGWVQGLPELLAMLGIMLAVYLVIFLVMFMRYRAEVRKLNELLEKSREKDAE